MFNGTNQYLCHFCNQPCKRETHRGGPKVKWHRCVECPNQVLFAVNCKGNVKGILFLVPAGKEKELYRLEIDFKKKWTSLSHLRWEGPESWKRWRSTPLAKVESALTNINHSNVFDKIKTLIAFS